MTTAHSLRGVVVTKRARSLLSVLASGTGLGSRLLSATLGTAFLALAVRSSFLLLSTGVLLVVGSGGCALLDLAVVVGGGGQHRVGPSGCSHSSEDLGVGLLQLRQNFLAVLRLR